jgi:hypothetical protein
MPGDPKWQFSGSAQSFSNRPMAPRGSDQKQKPAAAGSEQFSASRTRPASRTVPVVDLIITDSATERPFQFPAVVQQRRRSIEVSLACQRVAHFVSQVAHGTESVSAVLGRAGLLLENLVRISCLSRVEQQDALL